MNGQSDELRQDQLRQVSRGVVQLLRRSTGRGPEACRADYANDNLLIVSISEGSLESEQTLNAAGRSATVNSMRAALQDALSDRLVAIVEESTGREVTAFMSANHANPDVMLEAFVLAPVAPDGESTPPIG